MRLWSLVIRAFRDLPAPTSGEVVRGCFERLRATFICAVVPVVALIVLAMGAAPALAQTGTIIIEKEAINGDGTTSFDFSGSFPPGVFSLTPPANGIVSQTFSNLLGFNTYSVQEEAVAGWSTSVSCTDPTGDTDVLGQRNVDIALAPGETVTCRFVNQRLPPPTRLILEKEAVNGDGTTAFQFVASNGSISFPFQMTPPANGVVSTSPPIGPGSYTVTETAVPGWTTTIQCTDPSGDTTTSGMTATIELAAGETVTCRFINSRPLPGTIVIEKEAVNGDGSTSFDFAGSPPVGNFSLTPPDNGVVSQSFGNIPAGSYTIAETAAPGWSTSINCTDPTGNTTASGLTATIDVASGETVTCRFVNTKGGAPGHVIIEKEAVNGDGATVFQFVAGGPGFPGPGFTFTLTPPDNGVVSQDFVSVPPGNYTATETAVPGWTTSIQCIDPTSDSGAAVGALNPTANVNVGSGETITCRFINTRSTLGTIIIEKESVNGDGVTTFQFAGTAPVGNFSLTPPDNGVVSQSFGNIPAGSYTIAETATPGWSTSVNCTDPTGNTTASGLTATIDVASGETVTCRFVNTLGGAPGHVIIEKEAVNGDGATAFQFVAGGPGIPGGSLPFTLTPPANGVIVQDFGGVAVPPGNYTATETAVAGWTTSIQCTDPTSDSGAAVGALNPTANVNIGPGETVTCRFVNTRTAAGNGSINIIKQASGGDGTFAFTSSNAALANFSLTTSGGTASLASSSLPVGAYVITEGLADGWTLSSAGCTGGASTSADVAARSVTINLGAAESVTCTFVNTEVANHTETIIQNFLERRADLLTTNTGGPRLIDRLQNHGTGSATAPPMNLGASGDEHNGHVSFWTSLRTIAAAKANADRARMSGLGMHTGQAPAREPLLPRYGLDFWVEGSFTYFDSDSKASGGSGHFGLLRIGADYLVTDTFLAGVMVQFDDMEESSKSGGYRIDGQGWMAGPYAEVRFAENLFFDAKALWGQSDNTVSPFQTYADDFSTERWLLSARVKGLWTDGIWKFTPSAEVIAFRDASDDYVDSLGFSISSQSVTIGRAIFGPEVSYRHFSATGWLFEPRLAVKGIWTFGQDDSSNGGNGQDSIDPLRARIEAGAKIQGPDGTRLELEGAYDGIGSDQLNATSGKASITIPLN